jgi:hypothetical protein
MWVTSSHSTIAVEQLLQALRTAWNRIFASKSPLERNRTKEGSKYFHVSVSYRMWTYVMLCLPPAFTLISSSVHSSTLKMEAICSSETSFDFQRITRRYIPEDNKPHT